MRRSPWARVPVNATTARKSGRVLWTARAPVRDFHIVVSSCVSLALILGHDCASLRNFNTDAGDRLVDRENDLSRDDAAGYTEKRGSAVKWRPPALASVGEILSISASYAKDINTSPEPTSRASWLPPPIENVAFRTVPRGQSTTGTPGAFPTSLPNVLRTVTSRWHAPPPSSFEQVSRQTPPASSPPWIPPSIAATHHMVAPRPPWGLTCTNTPKAPTKIWSPPPLSTAMTGNTYWYDSLRFCRSSATTNTPANTIQPTSPKVSHTGSSSAMDIDELSIGAPNFCLGRLRH